MDSGFKFGGSLAAEGGFRGPNGFYGIVPELKLKYKFDSVDWTIANLTGVVGKDPAEFAEPMGPFTAVDTANPDHVIVFPYKLFTDVFIHTTKKDLPEAIKTLKKDADALWKKATTEKDGETVIPIADRIGAFTDFQAKWKELREAVLLNGITEKQAEKLPGLLRTYESGMRAYRDGLLLDQIASPTDEATLKAAIATAKAEIHFMTATAKGPLQQIQAEVDAYNKDTGLYLKFGQYKGIVANKHDFFWDHNAQMKQLEGGGLHLEARYKHVVLPELKFDIGAKMAFMTGTPFAMNSFDGNYYAGKKGSVLSLDANLTWDATSWLSLYAYGFYQRGFSEKVEGKEAFGAGLAPTFTLYSDEKVVRGDDGEYGLKKTSVSLTPEFYLLNDLNFFAGAQFDVNIGDYWSFGLYGGFAKRFLGSGSLPTTKDCAMVNGVYKCFDGATPSSGNELPGDVKYDKYSKYWNLGGYLAFHAIPEVLDLQLDGGIENSLNRTDTTVPDEFSHEGTLKLSTQWKF